MAKISSRDTRTSKNPRNHSNGNGNSYNMDVSYRGSLLTVTSPGGKSITLDLSRVENDNLHPMWVVTLDRLEALRAQRGDDFKCLMFANTLAHLPLIKATEGKSTQDTTGTEGKAENANLKAMTTVNGVDVTLPNGEKPPEVAKEVVDPVEVKEPVKPVISKDNNSKLAGFVRDTQEAQANGLQRINRRAVAATSGLEERVATLKSIDRSDLELWCVNYDIPVAREEETGRRLTRGVVPNPSGEWWAYGARLTLSQWLFTKEGLESEAVQERIQSWLDRPQKDVKVRVVKQCPSQTDLLKGWAREKLQEMISQAQKSMIDSLASAHERWQAAEKALEDQQLSQYQLSVRRKHALRRKDQDSRNILKSAAEDLNNAVECAQQFDMTEDVCDLLKALRLAVSSQQQSFNAEVRAREGTPSRVHVREVGG